MRQLIINTEYFLQCQGHCSGCFLSEAERASENTYEPIVREHLWKLAQKYPDPIEHLVIGFGRGNLLNLPAVELDKLLTLMKDIQSWFSYEKLTFEVATSLIGKIEQQIEKAHYLLNQNCHIYFNMVINSEITSLSFWNNLDKFYHANKTFRQEHFGWTDNTADILVLNVNPENLPDLGFLETFTKDYPSAINISIFPFNDPSNITNDSLKEINEWSQALWQKFSHKDLNIKNYLHSLSAINLEHTLSDYLTFYEQTEKSYYFIDKRGDISNGALSIMGEVDKIRLLNKYHLNLDLVAGYKNMQKNKACLRCEHQKECLLSGAYLNMLANQKGNHGALCLSGYQQLFELAKT